MVITPGKQLTPHPLPRALALQEWPCNTSVVCVEQASLSSYLLFVRAFTFSKFSLPNMVVETVMGGFSSMKVSGYEFGPATPRALSCRLITTCTWHSVTCAWPSVNGTKLIASQKNDRHCQQIIVTATSLWFGHIVLKRLVRVFLFSS